MALALLNPLFSQDERFIRDVFRSKKKSEFFQSKDDFQSAHKWKVSSSKYLVDLNKDGFEEVIRTQKRDGMDWILIEDPNGKQLFASKLKTTGIDSYIYKAEFTAIDGDNQVLILHFYEGYVRYLEFDARSTLYFLTISNKNLEKIRMTKGPSFWHESQVYRGMYHQRKFETGVKDYNRDGVKEIFTKLGQITRVWFYQRNGDWSSIN